MRNLPAPLVRRRYSPPFTRGCAKVRTMRVFRHYFGCYLQDGFLAWVEADNSECGIRGFHATRRNVHMSKAVQYKGLRGCTELKLGVRLHAVKRCRGFVCLCLHVGKVTRSLS